MAPGEGTVPSAARILSDREVAELASYGEWLAPGWVAVIEAPHGQIAISPGPERRVHVTCWRVDVDRRIITRERWRPVS